MISRVVVTSILVCVLATGCKSYTSTAINRHAMGVLSGESNGSPRSNGSARPFKGIPITLRVPTHLDIYIEETYYTKFDALNKTALEPLDGECRLLDVKTEVIDSEKVFTVDFKRPASGTLGLNLSFDEDEQYFSKIVSELEDTTITDVAALIAQSINSLQAVEALRTSTGDKENQERIRELMKASELVKDTRVVAYRRFDIDDVDFELQVEEFVNQHLNCCHQCGVNPSYDANY